MDEQRDLREQYRLAVAEYRFQVDLNWRRSEYFFVLNIGVMVAAATLLASESLPRALVALVFGLGALLAGLSFLANDTQHGYYKSARELKKKLETQLQLEEVALKTTPGMGSRIKRLGRVGTFLKTMLVAIALVDLVGAGIGVNAAFDSSPESPDPVRVVVRVAGQGSDGGLTAVVSHRDQVIATRMSDAGGRLAPVNLEPGRYLVSVLTRGICTETVDVSSDPLQLIEIDCGKT